jgi:hypothetical protein
MNYEIGLPSCQLPSVFWNPVFEKEIKKGMAIDGCMMY